MSEKPKILVYCRKPDLDSLTTAFLLGAREETHELVLVKGLAPREVLDDPEVICLECGGSGETEFLNFDHHEPSLDLPTAGEQAWIYLGKDPRFSELVDFVAWVDSAGIRGHCPDGRSDDGEPKASLSTLVSGMFLVVPDPTRRFWRGVELIGQVSSLGLRPWDISAGLSDCPQWAEYLEAKEKAKEELFRLKSQVRDLSGDKPYKILALSADYYGVLGLLRDMGGEIRIAHKPSDRKFTVSVDKKFQPWLAHLTEILNASEPGWGGPSNGLIIGSPFQGTEYSFLKFCEKIINLV